MPTHHLNHCTSQKRENGKAGNVELAAGRAEQPIVGGTETLFKGLDRRPGA